MTLARKLEDDSEFIERAQTHPLEAQLIRAVFDRADLAIESVDDQSRFRALVNEVAELFSWLFDDGPLLTETEIARSFQANLSAGWGEEMALRYLEAQRKRPRGRPRSQRRVALYVLEQRRLKGLSWMKLANRFCPCHNKPHTERCRERLRHEVMLLEEALTRLGV